MEGAVTVADKANRAVNFYLVAMLAIAGAAALPGLRAHQRAGGKIDDSLVVITALVGLTWYIGIGNRYSRRATPFILVIMAAGIKTVGVWTRGASAVSPDAALAVFLGVALVVAAGWALMMRGVRTD